jgi:hypothetical protein
MAQIDGRVRGAGGELVLPCDIRFAARESAILSQPHHSTRDAASTPRARSASVNVSPKRSNASEGARRFNEGCSHRTHSQTLVSSGLDMNRSIPSSDGFSAVHRVTSSAK